MTTTISKAVAARIFHRAALAGDKAQMHAMLTRVPDVAHRCCVCGQRIRRGVVGPGCVERALRNGMADLVRSQT